jgi:hypothetical protein
MPDEPIPVRRKIGLERCDDRGEHTTDALAWRQNLGLWHDCICSGKPACSRMLSESRLQLSRTSTSAITQRIGGHNGAAGMRATVDGKPGGRSSRERASQTAATISTPVEAAVSAATLSRDNRAIFLRPDCHRSDTLPGEAIAAHAPLREHRRC